MQQLTREDLRSIQKYVEGKALKLMKLEGKNDAITGVPLENYRILEIDSNFFFMFQTNTFKYMVEEMLFRAHISTPEKFGTGDAHDVIEAIRLLQPMSMNHDQFVEFLTHERCAYIFEVKDGIVIDQVLRLDLVRMLKPLKKEPDKKEFIGGLLHALKHFSLDGIGYTTDNKGHNLSHPNVLINHIVRGFFLTKGEYKSLVSYIVVEPYNDSYELKLAFHRQPETEIFFLNTAHLLSKPKSTAS